MVHSIALSSILMLAGTAAIGAGSPRAARSVHLYYPAPQAHEFYNEVTVEQSQPGSYFQVCGFQHGYFGIQEQGDGKKVVLFSVWDPGRQNNPHEVGQNQRVEVLFQADDVRVKRFGGEGTGGQCFFDYPWKPGQTYRFAIRAKQEGKKTAYSAYFHLNETKSWKHLVTFRTFNGRAGGNLRGLYSFIEDFRRDGKSAKQMRRASFGNGWVLTVEKKWMPLTRAHFGASGAAWEARNRIDAGVTNEQFYLQTGGDTKMRTPLGKLMKLAPVKTDKPAGPLLPPEDN